MNENAMREAFWQQARQAVNSVECNGMSAHVVGPEFEFFLYKQWGGEIATDE